MTLNGHGNNYSEWVVKQDYSTVRSDIVHIYIVLFCSLFLSPCHDTIFREGKSDRENEEGSATANELNSEEEKSFFSVAW